MIRPRFFFTLAPLHGTPLTRYAIVAGDGNTVIGVQVSMPGTDLVHIERPAILRWRHSATQDVQIKRFRINETPLGRAGGRQRRWRNGTRNIRMGGSCRCYCGNRSTDSVDLLHRADDQE